MGALFITFEGGEGAGKSTQLRRLTEHLSALGRAVVVTREPGGTVAAEEVRNLLVNGDPGKWSSTEEALLNYAARSVHIRNVIAPALALGKTVLCDRFMDSTRVYQGVAGDCPAALIAAFETFILTNTKPDLTFIFDIDPAVGLARAKQRGHGMEDRYERKGLAFHQALRDGFLAIARSEPARCVVLDANLPEEVVWSALQAAMKARGHG
jgi:dTMP kinase